MTEGGGLGHQHSCYSVSCWKTWASSLPGSLANLAGLWGTSTWHQRALQAQGVPRPPLGQPGEGRGAQEGGLVTSKGGIRIDGPKGSFPGFLAQPG